MKNNRFKRLLTILISIIVFAGAVSLIVLAGRSVHNKSLIKDMKDQKISLAEGFTVTAQTGCLDTVENSYISAKAGIRSGAQAIEADISFRKDGTPVLAAKLSEADENAVELERVFKYLVDFKEVSMVLNLKQVTNLKEIERLATKYNLINRIIYTGVTENQAAYVQSASPNVRFYIDCSPDRNKLNDVQHCSSFAEIAMGYGCIGINVSREAASKTLIDSVHSYGLKVSVYNVKNEMEMYKLLSLKTDNITTTKTDLLLSIVHEIQNKQQLNDSSTTE